MQSADVDMQSADVEMQSADVMTTTVVTVQPNTEVQEIARLLVRHRISAVPVVDADRNVLGIVSEGDLMRRPENHTEGRPSGWLAAFFSSQGEAEGYIKTHGRKAGDVMTRHVIGVTEDTPLREIADLFEKLHIKRVPVLRDGRLVGIVSRTDLLRGLAAKGTENADTICSDDQTIRANLLNAMSKEAGLDTALINVIVNDGVVTFWGLVGSSTEKKAAQIAAETTPGVKAVENNLGQVPPWVSAY